MVYSEFIGADSSRPRSIDDAKPSTTQTTENYTVTVMPRILLYTADLNADHGRVQLCRQTCLIAIGRSGIRRPRQPAAGSDQLTECLQCVCLQACA